MAPRKPEPFRTLGFAAIDWIEYYLVHGPGDVQGKPVELDDEFAAFIVKAYRVNGRGARTVRRAFLSRPKGRSKSGLASFIECFEALGPCRFDHWAEPGEVSAWGYEYEAGEPVGRPLVYVECLNVATEEGQAGNTYDAVYYILNPETANPNLIRDYGRIDVGLARTVLPGRRGFIEPITSRDDSKDGGKSTFIVADEALALDTPLPTPTGWTTMGDVEVGDSLIGSDGSPVQVVKVTDVLDERACYRVTFEDGTSVVASHGHLWQTKRCVSAARPKVRTTGEMFADGGRFRIPAPRAWSSHELDLPVDPYLLGLWLGDGSKGQPHIAASHADAPAVMAELAQRGIRARLIKSGVGRAARISFSARTGFHQGEPLGAAFRSLPCWTDKHVPEQFFLGSIDQRAEVVRGLMDSDGHIPADSSGCTFVGNEQLSRDLLRLLRSLGQVARRTWTPDPRSRQGGYWKVHFTPRGGFQPFSLPRKADRVRQHARGGAWVTITAIEPTASVPVRCVGVDAPDHLFLAGEGGHVTHNTHLWVLPRLKRLHGVMTRNLLKRKIASGWMLETSTMYAAGGTEEEKSVAEGTHSYAQSLGKKDGSLLFDHVQASDKWDLSKRSERMAALREAYGPAAAWMNLGAIADSYDDPQVSEAEFRRYWLNQPVATDRRRFSIVTAEQWTDSADTESSIVGSVALGVEVSMDGATAAIAASGRNAEGRRHGELTGRRGQLDFRPGTGWVVPRLVEIATEHSSCVLVLDPSSPAGALIPDLVKAGFVKVTSPDDKIPGGKRRLYLVGAREYAQACGAWQNDVRNDNWRHLDQQALTDAVEGARPRPLAGGIAWQGRDTTSVNISPLVATTHARHGHALFGDVDRPAPFVMIGRR